MGWGLSSSLLSLLYVFQVYQCHYLHWLSPLLFFFFLRMRFTLYCRISSIHGMFILAYCDKCCHKEGKGNGSCVQITNISLPRDCENQTPCAVCALLPEWHPLAWGKFAYWTSRSLVDLECVLLWQGASFRCFLVVLLKHELFTKPSGLVFSVCDVPGITVPTVHIVDHIRAALLCTLWVYCAGILVALPDLFRDYSFSVEEQFLSQEYWLRGCVI